MTRHRWIQQPDGSLLEVGSDYVSAPRSVDGSVLWNDRAYQDMGDSRFASRTQHREFMKQHGLADTSDFTGQWKKQESQRILAKQAYDPNRKQHINQAIQKLNGA